MNPVKENQPEFEKECQQSQLHRALSLCGSVSHLQRELLMGSQPLREPICECVL